MAQASQHIMTLGGNGMSDITHKRAVRLARMWLMLKDHPRTVKEMCAEFGVSWQTIYIDLIDLQETPLEPFWAPQVEGRGRWRIISLAG